MKNKVKMKRFLWIILIFLLAVSFSACGKLPQDVSPAVPTAPAEQTAARRIASVEVYNRTGRIQREDFYDEAGKTVLYSVEYTYTDSGQPSAIKRNGGGLGENRPIETYFYTGQNCTQRILYDANGGTQTVYYWTYDKKNIRLTEKVVSMILSENGYSYSGKKEELTTFNEDGTAKTTKVSLPGDYSLNEYEYGEGGRLLTDRYSHSSDDKTYRLFEVTSYTYNASGLPVRKTVTDGLGTVTEIEENEYDEEGNLLQNTVWASADQSEANMTEQRLYSYDEAGNLLALEETADGEKRYTFYEYDEAGKNTIITVVRYREDELIDKTVTVFTYDGHSNPVRQTIYLNGGKVETGFSCEYEYYDDGKIRTKINYAV